MRLTSTCPLATHFSYKFEKSLCGTVSLAVRMEGEEDGSEEKYYLRHDESTVSHACCVLPRDSRLRMLEAPTEPARVLSHRLCSSVIRTPTQMRRPGTSGSQVRKQCRVVRTSRAVPC